MLSIEVANRSGDRKQAGIFSGKPHQLQPKRQQLHHHDRVAARRDDQVDVALLLLRERLRAELLLREPRKLSGCRREAVHRAP